MKKITRRALFSFLLALLLLSGTFLFCIRYVMHGGEYVVFPGSPHVVEDGVLVLGDVTDRDGTVLLSGGKDYAGDVELRKATLHLLGDRAGNIEKNLLGHYSAKLVGYDVVNGLYSMKKSEVTARLTVSSEVQKTALRALAGRKGTVGVYNYKTGEILCAVSSPTFDPENPPDVEHDTSGKYDGVYLNRFFNAAYVPGSIFKLVTAAAALDTIPDIDKQMFHCEGALNVGGDTINCTGNHGEIDLQIALEKSCNCAFAELTLQLGADTLSRYVAALGITDSLQCDGITTMPGAFDVSGAADSDLAWAGIGQYTDLINPCSYLRLVGIIAGEGRAAEPHLLAEIREGRRTVERGSIEKTGRLLQKKTCERLSEMMHAAVEHVYGAGSFPDLYVCAKSGTAEVGAGMIPHATFTGFVKDESYPLAFIVVVENAGSGSGVCASIAGSVLKACVLALEQ